MKKQRLGIGRYKQAVQGLRGALAQLGLAFGVFELARGAFSVLETFDEKLADISKTTGLTIEQSRKLSQELLKIDTRTSVENLQELASAAGRLGITGTENIIGFAEAADKVFVALGDDLEGSAEEIATNLGKISSLFGLESEFGVQEGIEKVGSGINELAANSKASAPAILDFTQRMAGLADVLELSDVQSLGALFDESGQSIEVASTTLLKLLPKLATDYEKFADVAGMLPEEFRKVAEESPIEALKLVSKGAKNNEKGLFKLTKTLESYGIANARATGIVGVLSNNTERLTQLQELNSKAIKDNTSITDEFNIKNNTLASSVDKLKKAFQSYILEGEGVGNITDKLKASFLFLAQNMGTILSTIVKVGKAFVVFKGVLFALKMADRVKEFVNFGKAVKSGDKSIKDATSNVKKFGRAITAIGWTALISFVTNLALAFKDVATGAVEARIATEKFNDENDRAEKSVERQISRRKRLLENFKGTNKEREKLIQKLKEENRQNQIAARTGIQNELARQKTLKATIDASKAFILLAQTARESGAPLDQGQKDILALSDAYAESRGKALAFENAIKTLKHEFDVIPESITETEDAIKSFTGSSIDASKATNDIVIPSIERESKSIKELAEDWKELRKSRDDANQSVLDSMSDAEESTLKRNGTRSRNIIYLYLNLTFQKEKRLSCLKNKF